jgi:hypothetical protein
MSWVKLDDKRSLHRKFRRLGFAARGLDEAAICHCSHDNTDGYVSHDDLEDLAHHHGVPLDEAEQLAQQLVDVGRWGTDPTRGGWTIHDYFEFNPSAAEAARRRTAKRQAASLGGQRSGEVRRARASSTQSATTDASTNSEAQCFNQQRSTVVEAEGRTPSRSTTTTTTTTKHSRDDTANQTRPDLRPVASLTAGRQRNQNTTTAIEADFDRCWIAYPRRIARLAALRAYTARRRAGATAEELHTAVEHFAAAMAGRSPEHILHGATFFGPDERWRDYLDPPPTQPPPVAIAEPADIGPWARRNRPHPTIDVAP